MRRACLAALVLAVPLLGGFECNVTVEEGWEEGDVCSYAFDYPFDSTCVDSSTLYFCNELDTVQAWSCADECAGGFCAYDDVLGYDWCMCPDDQWLVGDTCDYWLDYPEASTCFGGTTLLMCNSSNVVQSWDCAEACGSSAGYCDYDEILGYDWCLCPEECGWEAGCPCNYATEYNAATCAGDDLTYCAQTNVIGSISCDLQCQEWYGPDATGSCGVQPETGYNGCVCEFVGCDFAPYCNDAIWLVSCDGVNEVWTDCDATCVAGGSTKGVCDAGACICD